MSKLSWYRLPDKTFFLLSMADVKTSFLELTRKKYSDQAIWYLNGFWKDGAESEAEAIWFVNILKLYLLSKGLYPEIYWIGFQKEGGK